MYQSPTHAEQNLPRHATTMRQFLMQAPTHSRFSLNEKMVQSLSVRKHYLMMNVQGNIVTFIELIDTVK